MALELSEAATELRLEAPQDPAGLTLRLNDLWIARPTCCEARLQVNGES